MKHALIAAGLLAAIAVVAGFLGYRCGYDPVLHGAACAGDEMAWLRQEYHLTDGQYAAIETLHRRYGESCAEHCRAIQEAVRVRDALRANPATEAGALAAAERRVHDLGAGCEADLLAHLAEVAALMSPEEGHRYLATMRPLVAKPVHAGAPEWKCDATGPNHEH